MKQDFSSDSVNATRRSQLQARHSDADFISAECEPEARLCPPFSIRAHKRSRSYSSPKNPDNVLTIEHKSWVEIYPDGARLTTPPIGGLNIHSGKHIRGTIQGWSKSSRRRMREFLLTHSVPTGWTACAVTFTIPGYPLELTDVKRLWKNWQNRANRMSLCCIWRIEIQKRGQLHWHLVAGYKGEPEEAKRTITESWHKALRSLGTLDFRYIGAFTEPFETDYIAASSNPMDWFGAEWYSARVDVFSDQLGPWKRYLQDHATKSKQEQIPENIGRHWGKINGDRFVKVLPQKASSLSEKQYARFLRAFNRLCTPYIRCPSALFGRRRGYTRIRGLYGTTVVFSLPQTIDRLLCWALS